jgi:hypothetical protein
VVLRDALDGMLVSMTSRQSDDAYTAEPETDEEQLLAQAAADLMSDWDPWDGREAEDPS